VSSIKYIQKGSITNHWKCPWGI